MTLDQAGHVIQCLYCAKIVTVLDGVKVDFPGTNKHVCPTSPDQNGNP